MLELDLEPFLYNDIILAIHSFGIIPGRTSIVLTPSFNKDARLSNQVAFFRLSDFKIFETSTILTSLE